MGPFKGSFWGQCVAGPVNETPNTVYIIDLP